MKYLLTLFLLPLSLMAQDMCVECPTCHQHLNIKSEITINKVKTGIWGDTWFCPNPNCGYENYTGINNCALCGTRQPGK